MLKPQNFFFELPIYFKIEITNDNREDFFNLILETKSIDGYNPFLKENTTYNIKYVVQRYLPQGKFELSSYEGFFEIQLTCVRTGLEMKYFVMLASVENEDETKQYFFSKVGPFPSIADLHISKFKQYDKVIDKKHLKEITRGIGLAANGVGIGSFVYLRRVFEFLIEEAHQQAINDISWNEDNYLKSKIVDKIDLLQHHLPSFLVQNKSIYSILSVGIHKLDEQECLKYFEALKVGIELILDEKVELDNKKKKIEHAKLKLQQITQQIKN